MFDCLLKVAMAALIINAVSASCGARAETAQPQECAKYVERTAEAHATSKSEGKSGAFKVKGGKQPAVLVQITHPKGGGVVFLIAVVGDEVTEAAVRAAGMQPGPTCTVEGQFRTTFTYLIEEAI